METEQPESAPMEIIIGATALESIERANVDIAISTAHRYPRSTALVKRKMMEFATLDEETAESCFYKLNRQGKGIEGPSIRLAEIAASCFGNLRYGARVIANDGKQVTAQGFCHDLESNVMSTFEVKRRITDKQGRTYSDDMQVVTGNAACAIAARNAIFKVVPFAFVKPIFLAAKQVAVGDLTTLADRRAKMLTKFAALGINEKRVCTAVEKNGVEEIGLSEFETLIGLHSAIRDGDQTIDEAFPEPKKPIVLGDGDKAKPEPEKEKKPRGKAKEEKPEPEPPPDRATPLQTLRNLMTASGIEEPALLAHLFGQNLVVQGDTLDKLPEAKIQSFIDRWLEIGQEIKK